jgi:branched-chain amino acid transport system ATP-binding protein
MKSDLLGQALRCGPAEREEIEHRRKVEEIIDFLEIQAYRKTPVGQLPTVYKNAWTWVVR